jgi:NADP-dependent 3-hydroxy acid dehydrogenase YdfG
MSCSRASRVVVVTGASSGIGAAIARRAAHAGHRLVLAARSRGRLTSLADELGRDALAVVCDVTDWDAQRALVAQAHETFGRIDAVVANAGCEAGSPFVGGPDTHDAWRTMVLTNVYGTALTLRAALPALIASRGDLVLIGSVAGRVALPGSLYSATKWAVAGMAESARRALVGTGARVTLLEPGRTDTPLKGDAGEAPLLDADAVARAALFALEQPPETSLNEIVMRPTGQEV